MQLDIVRIAVWVSSNMLGFSCANTLSITFDRFDADEKSSNTAQPTLSTATYE
jgi:hypothetical protein